MITKVFTINELITQLELARLMLANNEPIKELLSRNNPPENIERKMCNIINGRVRDAAKYIEYLHSLPEDVKYSEVYSRFLTYNLTLQALISSKFIPEEYLKESKLSKMFLINYNGSVSLSTEALIILIALLDLGIIPFLEPNEFTSMCNTLFLAVIHDIKSFEKQYTQVADILDKDLLPQLDAFIVVL